MTPAFFVEGRGEQKIIQHFCNNKNPKIVTFGLNGDSVSEQKIAERIQFHFKTSNNQYYPLVFIIDRENRTETCEQLEQNVKNQVSTLGISIDQIRLFFIDRKLESWIAPFLNDQCNIVQQGKTETINGASISKFEGKSSLVFVQSLFKAQNKSYGKTSDAVDLFKKIPLAHLASISPSFNTLYCGLMPLCPELLKASS